jgi:hypothetical protein
VTILLELIPFILRNWKLALVALALLGAGIVLERANMHGYQRRINEEKAQEITLLKDRIATLYLVSSQDTQRAVADAKLNTQLETLASDTPKNDGPCLDASAAHRVWSISGSKPGSAPIPSRRISNVLPWRHKRP